jgi:hypothetical protein
MRCAFGRLYLLVCVCSPPFVSLFGLIRTGRFDTFEFSGWYRCVRFVGTLCGGFAIQDGWTALIFAAANGHAPCTRLLLDAGADKNAKTNVRICSLPVSTACCLYHHPLAAYSFITVCVMSPAHFIFHFFLSNICELYASAGRRHGADSWRSNGPRGLHTDAAGCRRRQECAGQGAIQCSACFFCRIAARV